MNTIIEMSNEELIAQAPSVGTESAHAGTSAKYSYVPTTTAVNFLRDAGWVPVEAIEKQTRAEGRQGFQKHMVRFGRRDVDWGDRRPELLLTNSHDGGSSFQLDGGVFRMICSNGMVVMDDYGLHYRHRHVGFTPELFIENAAEIADGMDRIGGVLEKWETIELEPNEQGVYAAAAHNLLWPKRVVEVDGEVVPANTPIKAEQLLTARRDADTNKADLWTTFNRVQENVMRGGIAGRTAKGRRSKTKPVASLDRSKALNQALWTLTEGMAALKTTAV